MIKSISDLTSEDIAGICDHTFLNRSEAYREKAGKGESPVNLREKAFYNFLNETAESKLVPYAICIRPEDVLHARSYLDSKGKDQIVIASVAGFPDGSWYTTEFKINETRLAINNGANEIDFVLNYNLMKNKDLKGIESEISDINEVAKEKYDILTKMILETSELSDEQIISACQIADRCAIDFVKTSTGFSSFGAKAEHLRIMRENFSRGVKMSGGVNYENVRELLYAASGRSDGYIDLDSKKIRIGESSLLGKLSSY
ncbi:Deoxyribose-phosphate aldolase [uncultured archaeon]|nr:Deoxyribose-phosphate aldolase [uncultured archaeon]